MNIQHDHKQLFWWTKQCKEAVLYSLAVRAGMRRLTWKESLLLIGTSRDLFVKKLILEENVSNSFSLRNLIL